MTRAELRDAIRSYLDRANLTDDEVDLWIDIATGGLNTALSAHPRMMTRRLYTLPAGENLLPLPTDMLRLRTLMVAGQVLPFLGPKSRDAAAGYIMRGDVAEILPCPAQTTTFTMDYNVALGEENWVMDLYPQVYLYASLVEAAMFLREIEALPALQQRLSALLDALLAQGWNEQLSAGMVIRAV